VYIQVSWVKYKKALKLCGFNVTVVGLLFNLATWPLMVWRGCGTGYELPSFTTVVWHAFCFIVVEEMGFYYVHR
jgi:sterol desaturase/sphingolipid hydroxylase (fatty acid hydroxylase superfamily)